MFISNEREWIVRDRVRGAPDLVVEVLSPHPRIGETEERVGWFAEYGVRECWLIHQDRREVAVIGFVDRRLGERRLSSAWDPIAVDVLPEFGRSASKTSSTCDGRYRARRLPFAAGLPALARFSSLAARLCRRRGLTHRAPCGPRFWVSCLRVFVVAFGQRCTFFLPTCSVRSGERATPGLRHIREQSQHLAEPARSLSASAGCATHWRSSGRSSERSLKPLPRRR